MRDIDATSNTSYFGSARANLQALCLLLFFKTAGIVRSQERTYSRNMIMSGQSKGRRRMRGRIPPIYAIIAFFIGAALFIFSPNFIDNHFRRGTDVADVMPSGSNAIAVITPNGMPVGWLQVAYRNSLSMDRSDDLLVRYVANKQAWDHSAFTPQWSDFRQFQLFVSVSAANLALSPRPLSYQFDTALIKTFGQDNHILEMTAKTPGNFEIIFNVEVFPAFFRLVGTQVNDQATPTQGHEFSEPVSVMSIYNIPQVYVDALKEIVRLASALLALPILTTIIQWYLKRRKPQAAVRHYRGIHHPK